MAIVLELVVFVIGAVLAYMGYDHDPHVTWMIVLGAILMAAGGGTLIIFGDGDGDGGLDL